MSQSVRSAVLARRPVDAHERAAIVSFERLFDALDRPFSEQANKVHVTASAIVLTDDHRRVLLHKHKRLGLWLQPGGHIDEGELPWQAALRETVEETGLPAYLRGEFGDEGPPLVHVDVHPGPRGHTHLDLRYLVESPMVPPAPPEGESPDVKWFLWHNAVDLAEPGLAGDANACVTRLQSTQDALQAWLGEIDRVVPQEPLHLRALAFGRCRRHHR